jgi:hypothetical protein
VWAIWKEAAAIEHHDGACGSEILNLKKHYSTRGERERRVFGSNNPDRLFRIGFPRSSNRNTPFSVPCLFYFEPLPPPSW